MKKIIVCFLLMCSLFAFTACDKTSDLIQLKDPLAGQQIATISVEGMGKIKIMLFAEQAPKAVENFVTLAEQGYYDGVVFHRVIEDFMVQSGDPTATGSGGHSAWNSYFEDEFDKKLYCFRGALCMANSGENTNGSQFFIVQREELEGDSFSEAIAYHKEQGRGLTSYPGYVKKAYEKLGGTPHLDGMHTVFGQVIEGMDIVDQIAAAETDEYDKPVKNIVISGITISKAE